MDPIVIDRLPFHVEPGPLQEKLRVRPGSNGEAELRRLVEAAQAVARPKVIYKLAFIEAREDEAVVVDGTRFTSRVLRVNLDPAQRVFAFVGTSGWELENWAESHEDFLARFWADAINQAVLGAAMASFRTHLAERFAVNH